MKNLFLMVLLIGAIFLMASIRDNLKFRVEVLRGKLGGCSSCPDRQVDMAKAELALLVIVLFEVASSRLEEGLMTARLGLRRCTAEMALH